MFFSQNNIGFIGFFTCHTTALLDQVFKGFGGNRHDLCRIRFLTDARSRSASTRFDVLSHLMCLASSYNPNTIHLLAADDNPCTESPTIWLDTSYSLGYILLSSVACSFQRFRVWRRSLAAARAIVCPGSKTVRVIQSFLKTTSPLRGQMSSLQGVSPLRHFA